MSSGTELPSSQPRGDESQLRLTEDAATLLDNDAMPPSSQQTIPSTEGALSPIDAGPSFKAEANKDDIPPSMIIPSSLTPPPSSQVPNNHLGPVGPTVGYERSSMLSPPVTGLNAGRRETAVATDYVPPAPQQVVEASPDELRAMMQACIAEHARLKMETAHHKLQYNLLSLQAGEDAKRATVEHEMIRREVEALRTAEHSRLARRELSAAAESAQAKFLQVKVAYEQILEENDTLRRRVKLAKKVIQQKEDEIISLADERDLLLNRIRENREHFHIMRSPGGIFHQALTPKTQTLSTPVRHRSTPKQTPRSAHRETRPDRDHGQEPFAALLQVLSQENNSAPSTPTVPHRATARLPSKHTRNVQSLSSLPTTPARQSRDPSGLLPSVDLVPQTEPPPRYGNGRYAHDLMATPTRNEERGRKSRESTISADDNEELARQALVSVASLAQASFNARASQTSRSGRRHEGEEEEEEVFESQASQAASEMLRRDPRESFDVASSQGGGSRDGTPPPAVEKSAKLQAKLFAGLNKSGLTAHDKRKFSGAHDSRVEEGSSDVLTSPTKKLRAAGGMRDGGRVGLGIQYGREA